MIHVGRRSYPYAEEINAGIVREFRRLPRPQGASARVLDVGCGRGQLGEALRALDWEVWGLENNPEACKTAEKRLDRLLQMDLSDYEGIQKALGGTRFDALVFSDVLEHTYDPRTVLERHLELLVPGGLLFVSVPNAVVWTNRFAWAMGRVKYHDTGVMDRTHIRFFTFETAAELVRASGCSIERVSSTPHIARALLPLVKSVLAKNDDLTANPRAIIESPAYKAYSKWVYPLERTLASAWPAMLAFGIVVVGRKAYAPERAVPAAAPRQDEYALKRAV